jgi:hypothetical protein
LNPTILRQGLAFSALSPLRASTSRAAPYRASGLVHRRIADIATAAFDAQNV